MPGPITTQDLLDQVRDQVDESNTEDVSNSDILQALNRGQRNAANILVKHCEDFFITQETLTSDGTGVFAIPEASFGRRLEHVTVVSGSNRYPLTRVAYRDLHRHTSSATVRVPSVYSIRNREFVVKPTPISGVQLEVWYSKAPETLVLPQGRITTVSVASNYVLLDALGSDLTTSTDALGAFVNIVDAQTGKIKVSLQTQAISTSTKQVTFKTAGLTYAEIYNRDIAVAIPTTVENHDYVCAIQGTCVPDLPDACLDYLVQYAVTEIRRRMGESVQDDAAKLVDLEKEVERQWAGRESSFRVTNKARSWTRF